MLSPLHESFKISLTQIKMCVLDYHRVYLTRKPGQHMPSHTSIPTLTLKATVPSQKVQYLQDRSCCNKQSKQQRHRSEWLHFACSTRKKVITWEQTKAVAEIHIPETSTLDFWIFAGHHWCLISQLQSVALGLLVINFSLSGHQGEFLCTYPKWQKISLPSKYMCTLLFQNGWFSTATVLWIQGNCCI
jgi:hypothetical protein